MSDLTLQDKRSEARSFIKNMISIFILTLEDAVQQMKALYPLYEILLLSLYGVV